MVLKLALSEECALSKSTTTLTLLPIKEEEDNAAAARCSFMTIPTRASIKGVFSHYRFGSFKMPAERERALLGAVLTALARGTSTPLSRMEPMWMDTLPIRLPRACTSGRMSQAETLK